MALISFFDTESFVKEIISSVARCELLTLNCVLFGKVPSNFWTFFYMCGFCFFFKVLIRRGREGK